MRSQFQEVCRTIEKDATRSEGTLNNKKIVTGKVSFVASSREVTFQRCEKTKLRSNIRGKGRKTKPHQAPRPQLTCCCFSEVASIPLSGTADARFHVSSEAYVDFFM